MQSDAISEPELKQILKQELPAWTQVVSPLPEDSARFKAELNRKFTFDSFQSAIDFMATVAPACDAANHHPRWENVWKTLTVNLSTWDGALNKVTHRDIALARYFDQAYLKFGDTTP